MSLTSSLRSLQPPSTSTKVLALLATLSAALLLFLTALGTYLFLLASTLNYPGGHALAALASLLPPGSGAEVFLDNYVAMGGANKFGHPRGATVVKEGYEASNSLGLVHLKGVTHAVCEAGGGCGGLVEVRMGRVAKTAELGVPRRAREL